MPHTGYHRQTRLGKHAIKIMVNQKGRGCWGVDYTRARLLYFNSKKERSDFLDDKDYNEYEDVPSTHDWVASYNYSVNFQKDRGAHEIKEEFISPMSPALPPSLLNLIEEEYSR